MIMENNELISDIMGFISRHQFVFSIFLYLLKYSHFYNYLTLLEFFWNVDEDFKPVPECWIPAKDTEQLNGNPMPDENGHIPGIMKSLLKCSFVFTSIKNKRSI